MQLERLRSLMPSRCAPLLRLTATSLAVRLLAQPGVVAPSLVALAQAGLLDQVGMCWGMDECAGENEDGGGGTGRGAEASGHGHGHMGERWSRHGIEGRRGAVQGQGNGCPSHTT